MLSNDDNDSENDDDLDEETSPSPLSNFPLTMHGISSPFD